MSMVALAASAFVYIGTMGQSDGVGAHADAVGTVTPPYPTRVLMFNDTWGTRGPGVYLWSQYQTTGTTALVPSFETAGPVPPLSAADGYGETHVTAMMAEAVYEGSPFTYVGRGDASPGRVMADMLKGGRPYQNALADLTTANALAVKRGGASPFRSPLAGTRDRRGCPERAIDSGPRWPRRGLH